MKTDKLKIEYKLLSDLIPYINNAKLHPDKQIGKIASSIKEFGFVVPILLDADNGVIAGHGRIEAAKKLKMKEVPCVYLGDLTPAQVRGLRIAENQLTMSSGWDFEMLGAEIDGLKDLDFDLDVLGFDLDEISDFMTNGDNIKNDDTYTKKIIVPIYEPKGDKPKIKDLFDRDKTKSLVDEITSCDLPKDISNFLILAAERHTSFHFARIAEFYCHSDSQVQDLMEKSGLVIIDFKKAIENGFVHMTDKLGALADIEESENDA